MRLQKKRIIKEDGRLLTFYHFPATATDSQTAAFNKAQQPAPPSAASEQKDGGSKNV